MPFSIGNTAVCAGESNGYMKAYLDGDMVVSKDNLLLSSTDDAITSIMFDNFFGGGSDMAAAKDEVCPCLLYTSPSPRD